MRRRSWIRYERTGSFTGAPAQNDILRAVTLMADGRFRTVTSVNGSWSSWRPGVPESPFFQLCDEHQLDTFLEVCYSYSSDWLFELTLGARCPSGSGIIGKRVRIPHGPATVMLSEISAH